jgi:hypothetical protein
MRRFVSFVVLGSMSPLITVTGWSAPPPNALRCFISVPSTNFPIGDSIPIALTFQNTGTSEIQMIQPSEGGGEMVVLLLGTQNTNALNLVPLDFEFTPEAKTNAALMNAWGAIEPGQSKTFPLLVRPSRARPVASLRDGETFSGSDYIPTPGNYELLVRYENISVSGSSSFRDDLEYPKYLPGDPRNPPGDVVRPKADRIIVDPEKVWKGELQSNIVRINLRDR